MVLTRRDFAAVVSCTCLSFAQSPKRQFRGVFPIMQTPFRADGKLDVEALTRQVDFLNRIRIPGMVWPQLASEYSTLTMVERLTGAEAIMQAARKKEAAIVLGVQGPDVSEAVKYARHAEKLQPDGIVAIPLNTKDLKQQIAYYRAITENCSRPLFVQTIGDMSVDFVYQMASTMPTLQYVKDEAGHTLSRLSEYQRRGAPILGAFTGAHGRTLLDEMARGSAGTMPAAGFADLYQRVWDLWHAGDRKQATDLFGKTLLLVTQVSAYGIASLKYVLELRGVFRNSICRSETQNLLDDPGKRALKETFDFLQPYLAK
jgi:4-hydroxy-tetrahydrodipicolinate synthase